MTPTITDPLASQLQIVMSKLLEHVIVTWCGAALKTTDNQFGFKRNASSGICVFTLKQSVSEYND